jgi:NTE family protein
MTDEPISRPDHLVLGAGGTLGEAWLSSLLAGLIDADSLDPASCKVLLGTSAGSIVATMLAAGADPRERLAGLPEPPPVADQDGGSRVADAAQTLRRGASLGLAAAGAVAPAILKATTPGGRLVRRAALSRVPPGRRTLAGLSHEITRSGVDWDGRLRISAVELGSGRRIIFDGAGEPEVSVAEAVEASCAIPGVFRPLAVDGRSYVDGGVWSPTNLDAVDAGPGARVLCLNPTAAMRPSRRSPLGAYGPWSRSMSALEASALRHRGAKVWLVWPDRDSATAMGPNLMNASRRPQVMAAGLAQGRRLGAPR